MAKFGFGAFTGAALLIVLFRRMHGDQLWEMMAVAGVWALLAIACAIRASHTEEQE